MAKRPVAARRGYTLPVLLVVLAAAGVSAAYGPPYLARTIEGLRVEMAADDIADALSGAREAALGNQKTVRVVFSERDRFWQVDQQGFRKLPDGVVISAPQRGDDGSSAIVFHPDGSSDGGQVVVSARGTAWSLAVEHPTGELRRRHAVAR